MVYEGLGGSTRANVASSLGFPEDEQRFRDGFKVETIIQLSHLFHFLSWANLQNIVPAPGANSSAAYANLVTVDKSAGVLNSYGRVVQDVFHAQPYQHPFDQVPTVLLFQFPFC